ncbi:MAG TPA: ribonuclease R [Syntrophorhabdaceae bacterium]|nr:ribonuclease R [Syntrophorhabdaceae bacterium]
MRKFKHADTPKTRKYTKSGRVRISERHLYAFLKRSEYPVSFGEICGHFNIEKHRRKELKETLACLLRGGSIARLNGRRFTHVRDGAAMTGTLLCTRSGNGFVVPETEGARDVFISSRHMRGAMHGDTVTVRLDPYSGKQRPEGWIVDVVSRNTKYISGHIESDKGALYIIPEDSRYNDRFRVLQPQKTGTKPGQGDFVTARITKFNAGGPECEVVKIFRNGLDSVQTITDFVTTKFDLPLSFGSSIESEAVQLPLEPPPDGHRKDLRGLKHVTIDGELAKDFDDAVCLERIRGHYILYVSIADVSAFVRPHSEIDDEAYQRGTSIYFPGKVIPMLPEKLSNDQCSINPFRDKLALTVEMHFDMNGDIIQESFYPSTIRSVARFTYHEVQSAITGNEPLHGPKADCLDMLEDMAGLASLIKGRRQKLGSLDFDLPEPQVLLDIEGGIEDIARTERLFSHEIIEEFMIAANESVARFLNEKGYPAVYRIHEGPDREKLSEIQKFLPVLTGKHKKYSSRMFIQSIIKDAEGTPYQFFLNRVVLRSMKQARYSAVNEGHYGLASKCYLHFTSPIRRYPDLVCHRSLKTALTGRKMEDADFETIAIHLSGRERIAMEAERDLIERTRILFMRDKTNRTYNGIISHVSSFGFHVELIEVFVEGLVLLSDLTDDFYRYEENKFRIFGKKTRKIYRIGDKIRIRVISADPETRRLLFFPV